MKKGFTLVELMLVVLIFSALFAALLTVLASSQRGWTTGHKQLEEQQEARKAVDSISKLLRKSNPDWVISGVHYPVSITDGNRIDFYEPVFDVNGNISYLKKVTFKLEQSESDPLRKKLVKKEGTADSVTAADGIVNVVFGGGCAGCTSFTCTTVANDCPVVTLQVTTNKNAGFTLVNQVTLRNTNVSLDSATEVEEPEEGEF